MINVEKQIAYWRESASEDFSVSRDLLKDGKTRHGLFFLHLAFEKMLKAHVCKFAQDLAPRTHDLIGLAARTGMTLSSEQTQILDDLNEFNIEGRYPSLLDKPPSKKEARALLKRASGMFRWLTKAL